MKKSRMPIFFIIVFWSFILSCEKELPNKEISNKESTERLKSIPVYPFNWETDDWMPTPPGQSRINPPWTGQRCISYGIDVLNDHKAADGWVLVYSTFDPNAGSPLVNPYFMLYNRYRGLLRIYMYITTQFIEPSSYLQDGISVVSNSKTTLLNFLGSDFVDLSMNNSLYSQMQAAPGDGTKPLASNKWYLLEYEMAYDPTIANMTDENIRLKWFCNYYGISEVSLGGSIQGDLKGTIGTSSSTQSNFFNALANGGKVVGEGVLSAIGNDFLDKHKSLGYHYPDIDLPPFETNNDLGLSNDNFSSILKGVNSALSGATGNLPGTIVNIFSAIFGGNSGSTTQTVSLKMNASISLKGTISEGGSFPSMPTSVYMPGSQISPLAQNYIPLYNNSLGVFNLTQMPTVYLKTTLLGRVKVAGEPKLYYNYENVYTKKNTDIINSMIFNPAVINSNPDGATIKNIVSEIVLIDPEEVIEPEYFAFNGRKESHNLSRLYTGLSVVGTRYVVMKLQPYNEYVGVRISFNVVPNNGAPITTIVKTFVANLVVQ